MADDPESLLEKLYLSIKDSFDSHSRSIRDVLKEFENRRSFFDELKKHNLVRHLQDEGITYDEIRTQVLSNFDLSRDVEELELCCQHFLTSLLRLNKQSATDLSRKLRKEWNREARKIDSQKFASFLSEETLRKEEVQLIGTWIGVDDDPLMAPIKRQSSAGDRHRDHQGHSQHQRNDHSQHHNDHPQHHHDHPQHHRDHSQRYNDRPQPHHDRPQHHYDRPQSCHDRSQRYHDPQRHHDHSQRYHDHSQRYHDRSQRHHDRSQRHHDHSQHRHDHHPQDYRDHSQNNWRDYPQHYDRDRHQRDNDRPQYQRDPHPQYYHDHSQHLHADSPQHYSDPQYHNNRSQRHNDYHRADSQNHRQRQDHSHDRFSKEMNTDNEPAKAFEEHYNSIVDVIGEEDIFSKVFYSLCEAQLVPAAIEDQAKKITNRTIRVKCVMESVYTGIEKAVQPAKLLEKFLFILNLPEFHAKFTVVIQKFKEKGYSPNLSRNMPRKHDTITQQHPPENTINQKPCDTYSSDSSSAITIPCLTNAEESRGSEDNDPPSHHLKPTNDPVSQPIDYQSSLKMRYTHPRSTIGHQRKSWQYFHVSVNEKSVIKVSPEQPDGFLDLACIPQKDPLMLSPRTLILGAPGVGKSSIVNELCLQWSRGHLLKDYEYVIRLRANEDKVRKAKTLKDLVPEKDRAYDSISQSYGRNCLFILDGYEDFCEDEELKENGFYDRLIRGEDLPDELLAASLIVTTRPWCAKQIMKYFPREIEILGFTSTTQKEYLSCMYQLGEADVKHFLSQPRTMAQCMSNPLLLSTLVEIFIEYKEMPDDVHAEQSWPKTLTSLYGFLIRLLVLKFVRNDKTLSKHLLPAFSIPTGKFFKFPRLIYEPFLKVCSVAYQSISTRFLPSTFEHDDLITFELINGRETIEYCDGQQVVYEFLHSSIREYLAAYFISRMDEREMEKRINCLKASPYKNHLVIEFLFGFGCINEIYLEKYQAKNEYRVTNFNILRQLCEAEHSCDLIKSAFAKFSEKNTRCIILRTFPSPSPFDFWCLGRVIALSDCEWELGFTLRPIQDEHIKSLREGFDSVDPPSGTGTIKMFKFSFTKVRDEGVNQICQMHQAKVLNQVTEIHLSADFLTSAIISKHAPLTIQLKNFHSLSKLMLHYNNIKPGQHLDLIVALKDCRSLEHVSFTDLAPNECHMLVSEVKQLEVIELWNIATDCCRAAFESLDNNRHVQRLEIHECDIGTETAQILPRTLPRSAITCLKLINCNINDATVEFIVVAVEESRHREISIDLSNNVLSDKGGRRLLALQDQCNCNLLDTYRLNNFYHTRNDLKPHKRNKGRSYQSSHRQQRIQNPAPRYHQQRGQPRYN